LAQRARATAASLALVAELTLRFFLILVSGEPLFF
jgi:hypothetical protein